MKNLKRNILKLFSSLIAFTSILVLSNIVNAQIQIDPQSTNSHLNEIKNIVIIGPPASGKGTQGEFISTEYNIPKISTGDILRAEVKANTDIGKKVKSVIESGKLVDNETIISLLKTRLESPDTNGGFILDGFPRTITQAEELQKLNIDINYVIELKVSDEEVISRISGRRVHPASGRSYHTEYNPPKVEGKDDITQEPLVQRDDDKEEAIVKRLKLYHEQTEPMTTWYKKLAEEGKLKYIEIDCTVIKGIDAIKEEISKQLK